MPTPLRNPKSSSNAFSALLREYFTLSQSELARWLGVSQSHVESVENGRREFSWPIRYRLHRLTELMPPRGPARPAPETLPPLVSAADLAATEAAEADELHTRLLRCQILAERLGWQIRTLALQDVALLRRRQSLAVLRAGLAIPPPPGALGPTPAEESTWLLRLEADTAAQAQRRPGRLARAHLALRQRLLLEEAAAITELLAGTGQPAVPGA